MSSDMMQIQKIAYQAESRFAASADPMRELKVQQRLELARITREEAGAAVETAVTRRPRHRWQLLAR